MMKRLPTDQELDTMSIYELSCLANAIGCGTRFRDAATPAAAKRLVQQEVAKRRQHS